MIIGIGVDIVSVLKIKRSVQRWGSGFLDRVYAPQELDSLIPGKVYYQRLAARFAAKEAVFKAISVQYRCDLNKILILNRPDGAPYCILPPDKNVSLMLSISHIEDYAVASAIAQTSV